jgi:3-hydroxyacyl-[acyl-carrier-protein] dehydratase
MTKPLTPHGPGFSFVDRFVAAGPGSGTAWKFLAPESPFFADHFPGNPVMPAVLLAECAAQAAGTAWMHGADRAPGTPLFLASIDRFRVKNSVGPGRTVQTEVTLIREMGPLAQFAVRCLVEETEVAAGQLVLSVHSRPADDETPQSGTQP